MNEKLYDLIQKSVSTDYIDINDEEVSYSVYDYSYRKKDVRELFSSIGINLKMKDITIDKDEEVCDRFYVTVKIN